MKSVLTWLILPSLLLMTTTFGGMTLFQMNSSMDASMNVADTMNCLTHCLQVFSIDTIVPTVMTFFFFCFLFLSSVSFQQGRSKSEHIFQKWRDFIALFLRHQQISTIVLLD